MKYTSVVRLLESAADTHWVSTWEYTALPGGVKKTDFGIDPWFSISLNFFKNHLSNHWSSKLLVL
jgi:hypothetical protein